MVPTKYQLLSSPCSPQLETTSIIVWDLKGMKSKKSKLIKICKEKSKIRKCICSLINLLVYLPLKQLLHVLALVFTLTPIY